MNYFWKNDFRACTEFASLIIGRLERWNDGFWPPARRPYGSERKMGQWSIGKIPPHDTIDMVLPPARRAYAPEGENEQCRIGLTFYSRADCL
jgi:hypothetical protein